MTKEEFNKVNRLVELVSMIMELAQKGIYEKLNNNYDIRRYEKAYEALMDELEKSVV